MFGRRNPRSLMDQVRAWLWPKRGFRRAGQYVLKRVMRMKGSPHAVAAGFASGAAVSFLPLPGLHLVLGALLAFALRGNLIASAVGTAVGNPWTFPFIWIGGYRLGHALGFGEGATVSDGSVGASLWAAADSVWRGRFVEAAVESWPVLQPTLVGGGVMALVVWTTFYLLVRKGVAVYQGRRSAKLAAGRARWRREPLLAATEKGRA